jgi:WD40 repeat protein
MGNIKFVATTSNNNSINFWDSNNYIFRERLNTSEIQMCSKFSRILRNFIVKWCGTENGHSINRLFTGGCDAVIHAYDVQKLKEIGVREGWNPLKKDRIGHDGPIMDLLPIPD